MKIYNKPSLFILLSILQPFSLLYGSVNNNPEEQNQIIEIPTLQKKILDQYGPWYAQQVAQAIENDEEDLDLYKNIALPPYLFSQYLNDYRNKTNQPLLNIAQLHKKALKYTLFLLDADVDVNQESKYESRALHLARSKDVVQLLIKHKANVHIKNKPLLDHHLHRMLDNKLTCDHIKIEISKTSNPERISQLNILLDKRDPIHLLKIIETLICSKANIDERSSYQTPLHSATYHKLPEVIRLLIIHGADTELQNIFDETAFDYLKDNPDLQKVFHEAVAYRKLPESEKMGLEDFRS